MFIIRFFPTLSSLYSFFFFSSLSSAACNKIRFYLTLRDTFLSSLSPWFITRNYYNVNEIFNTILRSWNDSQQAKREKKTSAMKRRRKKINFQVFFLAFFILFYFFWNTRGWNLYTHEILFSLFFSVDTSTSFSVYFHLYHIWHVNKLNFKYFSLLFLFFYFLSRAS